jgi:hypothetical protein
MDRKRPSGVRERDRGKSLHHPCFVLAMNAKSSRAVGIGYIAYFSGRQAGPADRAGGEQWRRLA